MYNVRKGKMQLPVNRWARRQVILCGTCLMVSSVKDSWAGKMHVLPLIGGKVEEVKKHQHCLAFSSSGPQSQTYYICFDTFTEYLRWLRQVSKVASQRISSVDLSCCSLEHLPANLFYSQDLTHLNLKQNFLRQNPCLPTARGLNELQRFTKLKSLNLSNNHLGEFPLAVCSIPTLTELNVSCNALRAVPAAVRVMHNLQTFLLDGNFLQALPPELENMHQLSYLGLSFNEFTDIPEVLEKLTAVDKLCMSGNCMETLRLQALRRMPHIKHVDLRLNIIRKLIADEVDFLQHVTQLDLRDNKLGDLDAMIFNNIEVLHCERNQLVTLNICGYFLKALYASSNELVQLDVYPVPNYLSYMDVSSYILATKPPKAYNGHHQALEVLLQSLVDLDIRDEKGRTALDLAAFKGHTECVEALINQGASIFVKDNVTKRTPLHASVINGHTLCLRLLLEIADNPEAIDVKDAKGQTPLMLAVAYGHIDAVSLLLEKEANVDAVDVMGCTALHRGIMTGHEECVQMLLEQEVSILCKDSRGRTPLHYAAARGHATWLSELLQMALSEEDCSFKDNQGYTPLHWACYNGNENCIEVLLEQKCFRTFIGNPFTPLHCAIINDHENCASLLLGAIDSSIVNCRDDKGRTPLHAAAFADHVECLQLLLRHSAEVNAADNSGKTALMMAAENGQAGAVDILVNSAQADLTVKDKDLNTSLHLASSKGHEKCALLILDKIQDESLINARNNALQTPLHVAARNGLKVVVEELLAKGACVLAIDENGHTPALACAPNKDVADCLALILATMMPFSPPSTMTAVNFVCFKKDNLSRTTLSNLGSMVSLCSNNVGSEDGYNENDSDSETF